MGLPQLSLPQLMVGRSAVSTHTLAPGAGYDPIVVLGAKLIEDHWAGYGVTLDTGGVSQWQGRKLGWLMGQSLIASRPAFSATAYNGLPGIIPDDLDDFLELIPAPAELPDMAEGGEIWVFMDQTLAPAVVTTDTIVMYGNTINDGRRVLRVVNSGANALRVQTGTGATSASATLTTNPFTGRHVVRCIFTPTESIARLDDDTGASVAAVPATVLDRLRFWATSALAAGSVGAGVYNRILFTHPLSDAEAAGLISFGMTQGQIA